MKSVLPIILFPVLISGCARQDAAAALEARVASLERQVALMMSNRVIRSSGRLPQMQRPPLTEQQIAARRRLQEARQRRIEGSRPKKNSENAQ